MSSREGWRTIRETADIYGKVIRASRAADGRPFGRISNSDEGEARDPWERFEEECERRLVLSTQKHRGNVALDRRRQHHPHEAPLSSETRSSMDSSSADSGGVMPSES